MTNLTLTVILKFKNFISGHGFCHFFEQFRSSTISDGRYTENETFRNRDKMHSTYVPSFFSPLSPPISSESSEYLAANEANLSRDMFVFVFVGVRGTVPDSTSLNPTRPLSIKGFQIQPIRSLKLIGPIREREFKNHPKSNPTTRSRDC